MKRFLLASGVLLLCFVVYEYLTLPDVSPLKKENPQMTALMSQREQEAKVAGKKARRYQLWTGYAAISPRLRSAVLIGEDDAFYQHEGYDLDQIKESFARNWEKKGFVRGGSTITQQLAKNLYLSTSKNPLRKLREFLIARRLEEELGKRRILEIYLNVIEWGDGIYGAEAASHAYFDKPSKDLSVREAVLLAAVIPNPRRMNPSRPSRRVEYRFDLILSRMHQYRQISDQEFESARKESGDRGATRGCPDWLQCSPREWATRTAMSSGFLRLLGGVLLVHSTVTAAAVPLQRLRPPEKIRCSRDHLTSFSGAVLVFKRNDNETFLRMRTDEDTTEAFTLRHPGKGSAAEWFLLGGKVFEPSDWKRIEIRRNKLHPRMRATVWACDDGSTPVVDWQPPSE